MRRAALLLLALLIVALAIPFAGCGDDDDGAAETAPAPPPSGREAPVPPKSAEAPAEKRVPASVDLTVEPARIRGARVTATGAVQTLPPSLKSHRVAQENGYSSINSFGEEAAGEEATNITFALVQYLTARVEGDWATACARLYGVLRENLESSTGRPCPDAYGDLMSRVSKTSLEEQASIDVSSVRRGEGNRAFVVYKTPQTLSADMPMYVEDGVWKVGALEAYALRPGQAG